MALSAKLNLRQSQSMVMTPQLLQSIRLLQFTQLELDRFVQEQIENNPLLESTGAEDYSSDADNPSPAQDDIGDSELASDWSSMEELEVSATTIADRLDTSLDNVFPDDPGHADPGAGPASAMALIAASRSRCSSVSSASRARSACSSASVMASVL